MPSITSPFRLLWPALGLLICVDCAGAQDIRRLGPREISRAIPGMEFTDEVHWAYVFQRGGGLESVAMGKRGTGAWRQEKDRLCMTRPGETERCYEVWRAGKRVQLREPDLIPEEGILQRPARRS